jgi:hypothetical protein
MLAPAGGGGVAALALATVGASGEIPQAVRPTVLIGDDLLRVFQEAKDAAEQVDPPEVGLGTSFDPQPAPPVPSDYR